MAIHESDNNGLVMMRTHFWCIDPPTPFLLLTETGNSTQAKNGTRGRTSFFLLDRSEHPDVPGYPPCPLPIRFRNWSTKSAESFYPVCFRNRKLCLDPNPTPAAMSEHARYVMSPRIPLQRPIRTNSIAFNSVSLDCVSICDASLLSSRNHLLASFTGAFSRQSSAQSVHRHFASSISFCSILYVTLHIYHDASGPPWLPSLPVFSRSISERNLPSLSMDGLTQQELITLVTQKYTSCLERVRGSRWLTGFFLWNIANCKTIWN